MGNFNLIQIINEEIKRVIKENFGMEKLYHFTTLHNLWNIISANTFRCSNAYQDDVKPVFVKSPKYDVKKYPYYVSLTRMKDNLSGYPSWNEELKVRIVFNGSLLQTIKNSRIIPFNDFPLAKQNMNTIGNVSSEKFGKEARDRSSAIECEERFLSTRPIIPNVMNYVTRIDVGFKSFNQMIDCYMQNFYYALNDEIKKKIFFYYKENDFRYQTNNNVENLYILSKHEQEEEEP